MCHMSETRNTRFILFFIYTVLIDMFQRNQKFSSLDVCAWDTLFFRYNLE